MLVHLVKRDQAATNMLDTFTDAQDAMNSVKERLHEMMRSEDDFNEESYSEVRMLIDVQDCSLCRSNAFSEFHVETSS